MTWSVSTPSITITIFGFTGFLPLESEVSNKCAISLHPKAWGSKPKQDYNKQPMNTTILTLLHIVARIGFDRISSESVLDHCINTPSLGSPGSVPGHASSFFWREYSRMEEGAKWGAGFSLFSSVAVFGYQRKASQSISSTPSASNKHAVLFVLPYKFQKYFKFKYNSHFKTNIFNYVWNPWISRNNVELSRVCFLDGLPVPVSSIVVYSLHHPWNWIYIRRENRNRLG